MDAYENFSDAWTAGANKTIYLLNSVTLNALQILNGKNYSINLDGHTLTLRGHPNAGTTGGAICLMGSIYGGGDLSICNGTLRMTGENFSTYGIYTYSEDNLTLKNLTIDSNCQTVIYANGQQGGSDGDLVLDNVTINSTHSSGTALAIYAYKGYWDPAVITYNSSIKNTTINATYNAVMIYANSPVFEDCNISATNNNALWINNSSMASGYAGTVSIKGNTTITAGSDYKRLNAQGSNKIAIIEGTYNFDPTNNNSKNYVDTSSYDVADNGDGTWTVTAK